MEYNEANRLTQNKAGVIRVSFSGLAYLVLCAYMALLFLNYISWIPTSLVSLTLYGFIFLGFLTVTVNGRLLLGVHTVWYSVFLGLCCLSCVYSLQMMVSITMVIEMIKLLLFSVMFVNLINTRKRIQTVMLVASLAGVGLVLYLNATDQLDIEERLGESLTGNANSFVILFMVAAFCSIYFIYFSEKKSTRIISLVAFIIQMYALALSGSRKNFLLPLLMVGGLKMFCSERKDRKIVAKNLLIAIVLLIGALWAVYNVDFLYDAIGYRMEGLFNSFTGKGEVDASTIIRQDMIDTGLKLWKSSPFTGYGIDIYKLISGFGCYSHNNYIELLVSLGILGPIVYYWIEVYLLKKLSKANELGNKKWYWLLTIVCLLIFDYGAVTYNIYPTHMMLLLANSVLRIDGKTWQPT